VGLHFIDIVRCGFLMGVYIIFDFFETVLVCSYFQK
jgi:hypothetical protein